MSALTEAHVAELLAAAAERARRRSADNLAYHVGAAERWEWSRFVSDSGAERRLVEWSDESPQWPSFAREVMALLQSGGDLEALDDPVPWAARAHGIAEELPEWGELLELCAGSRFDAGSSALAVAGAVLEVYLRQQKEEELPPPPQGGAGGQGGGGQGAGQAGSQGGQESAEAGQGCSQGGEGAQALGQAQEHSDAASGPSGGDPGQSGEAQGEVKGPGGREQPDDSELRHALRNVAQAAAQQAEERQEALSALSWGLGGSDLGHVPPEEREKLAAKLAKDQRLKEVAREMGRLLRLAALKRRSEVKDQPESIVNVTTGNDLGNVLPSELALLVDGDEGLELDFWRRFAERQLLQYRKRGRGKAGRGPIVVMLDCSGSMKGKRLLYAVATTLALMHAAVKDGRKGLVIAFNSSVQRRLWFTRESLLHSTVELASLSASGGTDFLKPMRAGLNALEKEMPDADLVMVTDGYAPVADELQRRMKRAKVEQRVTFYLVRIGSHKSGFDNIADRAMLFSDDDLASGATAPLIYETTMKTRRV